MVAEHEPDRCDFLQLKQYFLTVFPPENEKTTENSGKRTISAVEFQAKLGEVQCLRCKGVLQRETLGKEGVIQLLCNPSDHIFCSKECFQDHCRESEGNAVCPECNSKIDEELVKTGAGESSWCSLS